MERLVITIQSSSKDGLLSVADAMQQVLDLLRLHDDARRAVPRPVEPFEWRLERASTNSPFTITARADPRNNDADVTGYVREVTREMSSGLRNLIADGTAAWWMDPESLGVAAQVFARNQNGIGLTVIETEGEQPFAIDRQHADAGLRAVKGIDVFAIDSVSAEGEAWGEIRGTMINAGMWSKHPAIRLVTEQYGYVWCVLTPDLARDFGHEQTLEEVWKGKTMAVEGRINFAASGKLTRIFATGITEVKGVPRVDLNSVVDPNFTDGLDPVEYLRRLHEGELA